MADRPRHRAPRAGPPATVLAWVTAASLAAVAVATGLGRATGSSPARPATAGASATRSPAAVSSMPSPGPASTSPGPTPTSSPPPGPTERPVPKPRIVWKPIPFPRHRLTETAAYARLHYGIDSWRIVGPHVIVEHFTDSTTFAPVWNEFAADVPDYEFHVLPGICAHFVIDRDGTIYQLVPLDVMCRHTVGLNWTAIGIEMVGTSDRSILANPRELRAALSLTLWLAERFHIQLRNVIGHAESLLSPYHHERVTAWRCQTHGDWVHPDMQVFRRDLGRMMRRYGIPPGPAWAPHPVPGC